MFMALVNSLVVLFYCCVTADILTKLLQQCFLIFIVVPWLYLGNSQVSVYRTIGPTLVMIFLPSRKTPAEIRFYMRKILDKHDNILLVLTIIALWATNKTPC